LLFKCVPIVIFEDCNTYRRDHNHLNIKYLIFFISSIKRNMQISYNLQICINISVIVVCKSWSKIVEQAPHLYCIVYAKSYNSYNYILLLFFMVCLVQHKFKIKTLQYWIQCYKEFKTNSIVTVILETRSKII